MTLVASLSPFGCPLMLGDILITGSPHPQTLAMLPTIGSLHLVDDKLVDLSRLKWLAQKVCIINDNLVVGWAGCYDSAKRIISSMREFEWGSQVTLEDVQQCLVRTGYDDQAAVSLAGIFSHNQGFGEFGLNASKLELPFVNQCRIIGSGKTKFLRVIQDNASESDMHLPCSDDSPWHRAVGLTLGIGGAFIGEEMTNFGGLAEGFGGAFEIVAFLDNKFAKLDDVLYCFWEVNEHSQGEISLSPYTTFVKIKYQDDVLLISRADFADRAQMRHTRFIIGPTSYP